VLQIRQPETLTLDDRGKLRQRWQVGAWKDVTAHPEIDRAWIILLGDGVEHRNAVVGEERVELLEEFPVVLAADVLEHPDRDDPVEWTRHGAVVLQKKSNAVGHA